MNQTYPSPLPASAGRHTVARVRSDQWSTREAQQDTERLSFETLDRLSRAMTARLTHGVSPHAQYAAWLDWASHLSRAPGRQLELWLQAARAATRLALFVSQSAVGPAIPPFVPQNPIDDSTIQPGDLYLTCFCSRLSSPRRIGGAAPRARSAAWRQEMPRVLVS